MIFISEQEVLELLNWEDTFCAIQAAMEEVTRNRAVQTARTFTEVLNSKNVLLTMPGYLENENYGGLACKLVTMCPNNINKEKALPTINANIMLFDQDTGIMKAVVAGTEITKWRTAAASAVATRHIFFNNSRKCKVLAILGCGVQGRIHAEAFNHFFDFEEIRVWDRNVNKSRHLAGELNEKGSTNVFKSAGSNEECVKDADVIITATYATSPIVKFEWVKPGAHINAIGAGLNHHSELDEKLYTNTDVYIDHWAGARKELSGLEKLGVTFKGEVGSVIIGDPSRAPSERITVFQSLGMAVEDCAMARLVYDLYTKSKNEGKHVYDQNGSGSSVE